MIKKKKILILVIGTVSALVIAVVGAVFAATHVARAQTDAFQTGREAFQLDASTEGGVPGEFGQHGPGFPGGGKHPGKGADNTYLAEALGITVEQLQTAYGNAWQNGIDQAVENGLITAAQAEWLKEGGFGMRGKVSMLGEWLGENNALEMNALLAEELGISVEELQAARQKASEAALQAAIGSGEITQEMADRMRARQALMGYIDRDALDAQALGISVDELQAARQESKSMPSLIEELGLTQEKVQEAMQTAYVNAIQQAVEDGVITQAQADLLLSEESGPGRGFLPGFDRGGFPGRGCP